jgi:hypothetical protein
MTNADWIKPGFYGAVLGIGIAAVLGFTIGGWQTAAGSAQGAAAAAKLAVTSALVPVCLEQSNRDPSREARLALLQQASLSTRRDLLMDTGWATVPGSQAADRDLAQACLVALDLPAS